MFLSECKVRLMEDQILLTGMDKLFAVKHISVLLAVKDQSLWFLEQKYYMKYGAFPPVLQRCYLQTFSRNLLGMDREVGTLATLMAQIEMVDLFLGKTQQAQTTGDYEILRLIYNALLAYQILVRQLIVNSWMQWCGR